MLETDKPIEIHKFEKKLLDSLVVSNEEMSIDDDYGFNSNNIIRNNQNEDINNFEVVYEVEFFRFYFYLIIYRRQRKK